LFFLRDRRSLTLLKVGEENVHGGREAVSAESEGVLYRIRSRPHKPSLAENVKGDVNAALNL
jgi:hypothetical protein